MAKNFSKVMGNIQPRIQEAQGTTSIIIYLYKKIEKTNTNNNNNKKNS